MAKASQTHTPIIRTHKASTAEVTVSFFRSPAFANFTVLPTIHGKRKAAIRARYCKISSIYSRNYNSQLPTVLGNGTTSRMFETPVKYMTHLSKPRPKPACLAEPYFLISR